MNPMKKLILPFFLGIMPAFLGAQTYSVKLYNSYKGSIAEYMNPLAEHRLEGDFAPVDLNKEKLAEFLAENRDFFEIILQASSKVKTVNKNCEYTEDYRIDTLEKKEFLVEPSKTEGCVTISVGLSDKTAYTEREDKKRTFDSGPDDVSIKKEVKLGVPSIIHAREEIRKVYDMVPFWGDIPLLGRLFRSEGETRQVELIIAIVTEVKE